MTTVATDRGEKHAGIAHVLHPRVLGCIVGASGATAFVFVNRPELPGAWPTTAAIAWGAAALFFVWAVLLHPRELGHPAPPRRFAGTVYVASVVGMVAVMSLGRALLAELGRPELQPAVVVVAVGLHFVPFAAAFRVPVFGWIGWSLAATGGLGVALGLAFGVVPAAAAAVLTGLVMLVLMGVDALRAGSGYAS